MTPATVPASPDTVARLLAGPGLSLRTGPFTYRLRSTAAPLAAPLALLYQGVPLAAVGAATLEDAEVFHDFEVDIAQAGGLRRWLRPQARFCFDGATPFEPLPLAHAYPMLEWAMNWCVSTHVNQYLLIHAAAVERGGRALLLPAPPGSGKSTLCAALVHRGWRLLSDEIAIVPFDHSGLRALVRPVSLKNASIDVIRAFAPEAVMNTPVPGTAKGTVAHVRAPAQHLARVAETALPGWVVFPRWRTGAPARLTPRDKAGTLVELARNSFNYGVLGEQGFETMAALVSACECHDFEYSSLDDALRVFDTLAASP